MTTTQENRTGYQVSAFPMPLPPGMRAPEATLDAVVDSKRLVARGVVELILRRRDGEDFPQWAPGAHVDLIADGETVRQYSLCGDPAQRDVLRVGILREEAGRGGSHFIHDTLEQGQPVTVRGPRNHFSLAPAEEYIFIAGGIGITPILAMIADVDEKGADWTLVYGGRTADSMAFVDELEKYGDRVVLWPQDQKGHIDLPEVLKNPRENTAIYCCGPEPLLNAVEEHCTSWPKGALHLERFAAKALTEPVRNEAFDVHLQESNIDLTIQPGESILSAVRDAGIEVLHSCAAGTCGTCETVVLEGEPDHRDSVLSEDERASNACMMICVSRSCTDRLVLDL